MSGFSAKRSALALLSGALFGWGLAVAGMTDPNKVLAFLDVTGDWDPSLLGVMGAAVVLCFFGFCLILKRQRPLWDTCFALPWRTDIDGHLIGGSVLFGLGWGLAGYCPAPALASVGFGNTEAAWFLPAMLVGMFARRCLYKVSKGGSSEATLAPQA